MERSEISTKDGRFYAVGNVGLLRDGRARVCITGNRKPTPYGEAVADMMARAVAHSNCIVMTGGAVGVQETATRVALDEGAQVIEFLAGGLYEPYPRRNQELFERVLDHGGLLLSQQEWGEPPTQHMFRARNGAMARMSDAVVVCECGVPSGTFSLCDEAMSADVPVFAVPGNITSEASRGCNELIAAGATLIPGIASLLDELRGMEGGRHVADMGV